ncbi:MAG: IS30 family transposase [Chlamydiia bacterium]
MPEGYHHLTKDQRFQFYALKCSGKSTDDVAVQLGVHRSTLYRELRRNVGQNGYAYQEADDQASTRKQAAELKRRKIAGELIAVVEGKLALQWSPEQISGWLKTQTSPSISHETIYKHIWEDKRQGGSLYKNLRHHGKKYNKRGSGKAGRGCIPGRVDIAERPAIVDEKSRLGDWELDTIIGREHKGAIVSMVERHSKLTRLAKVEQKTALQVKEALLFKLENIIDCVHTLTSDNGKEFAYHQDIASQLEASMYFARPYHSWERGLNEHTNGLVRQYLPKHERLDTVTQERVDEIENLLNNRPRKILQFRTPLEVFNQRRAEVTSGEYL